MTERILARAALGLTSMCVITLGTTGCTEAGGAMQQYADLVAEQPGVTSTNLHPDGMLAFATSGVVTVFFEPTVTRDQFDALLTFACDTDVDADVELTFGIEYAGGAEIVIQGAGFTLERCSPQKFSIIEALPVIAEHQGDLVFIATSQNTSPETGTEFVDLWAQYSQGEARDSFTSSLSLAHDLLAAVVDSGERFEWNLNRVKISSTDLDSAKQVVALSEDLAEQYPVARVAYDEELLVQLDTLDASVVTKVAAYLGSAYPDVPVRGVIDSRVTVSSEVLMGISSAEMLAVADLVAQSGLAKYVSATEFGVNVTTDDETSRDAVIRLVSDAGLSAVKVTYGLVT